MDIQENIYRVAKILYHAQRLTTLVNKKWYDEQKEMLEQLDSITIQASTLKNFMEQDITKDNMCKKLRNLCDIFSACENCPLYRLKVEKLKCAVSDCDKLSKLKFEEVTELYNAVEEWVKNFILED